MREEEVPSTKKQWVCEEDECDNITSDHAEALIHLASHLRTVQDIGPSKAVAMYVRSFEEYQAAHERFGGNRPSLGEGWVGEGWYIQNFFCHSILSDIISIDVCVNGLVSNAAVRLIESIEILGKIAGKRTRVSEEDILDQVTKLFERMRDQCEF